MTWAHRIAERMAVNNEPTRILSEAHWTKLRELQSLVFDVDGVLTDDTVWIGPDGLELKRFHVSDGLAIALFQKRLKVKVAAVSGRNSGSTTARARELGISPCLQGEHDKRKGVRKVLKAHRVRPERAAFVGNEILDLGGFAEVGFKIAVADAAPELAARSDLVLKRKGGWGTARELLELVCLARKIDYVGWF